MSKKNLSWCWRKGNRIFYSVSGVKSVYALDLLIMHDIPINDADRKRFKLAPRPYTPGYKSCEQAVKILQSKGWNWEKIEMKYD